MSVPEDNADKSTKDYSQSTLVVCQADAAYSHGGISTHLLLKACLGIFKICICYGDGFPSCLYQSDHS